MSNNYNKIIFSLVLAFHLANGSILLWGPRQIQFPALQEFTNKNLDDLLEKIESAQIVAFRSKVIEAANSIAKLLANQTTAYIPNSNINFDNLKVSELTGNQTIDLHTIQNILEESKTTDNHNSIIALLINEETKPKTTTPSSPKPPDNPVLYSASSRVNPNIKAMLYSSKSPIFETNFTTFNLEEAVLTTFDDQKEVTRLLVSIPIEDGKINLKFKFFWMNNYWHFTTIEGVFINKNDVKLFVLTPDQDIRAPRHFSFHCDGEIVFIDLENDVKLSLFDLQVQPDIQNNKQFGDAYDCSVNDHEKRIKRETEDELPSNMEIPYEEPTGDPVLYSAVSPTNKDVEAMIYSSRPPLLKINSSLINLGDASVTKVDVRDTYTRLIASIPVENGKISLRFKFPWLSSYWYLTSVEVLFIIGADTKPKQYNLTLLNQEITAPRRFSYHCGGQVSFVDSENEVELYLFEVQAQPDAFQHRFSDAYNCVPFTTGPLWSGLFVTFILIIGLIVGLVALDNIKTMDKFDNHKTKQLSITVCE